MSSIINSVSRYVGSGMSTWQIVRHFLNFPANLVHEEHEKEDREIHRIWPWNPLNMTVKSIEYGKLALREFHWHFNGDIVKEGSSQRLSKILRSESRWHIYTITLHCNCPWFFLAQLQVILQVALLHSASNHGAYLVPCASYSMLGGISWCGCNMAGKCIIFFTLSTTR